jgi:hypothetical protein
VIAGYAETVRVRDVVDIPSELEVSVVAPDLGES